MDETCSAECVNAMRTAFMEADRDGSASHTHGASDLMVPIIEETIEEDDTVDIFKDQLKQAYDDTEAKEVASYIRERWNKFATFRRAGHTGSVVMKGGHGMVADFLPGEYSLVDLACFSDLPPLVPKCTVIKGVKWVPSSVPGKSGKAIFPKNFDGKIVTDLATNELLRYYGCSFADTQQERFPCYIDMLQGDW
ncbi:hypothetical protein MAR_002895 [Mya arenaria]|uniref:Uncharacterized protein n=1 Tax=Mya arenaria TaxID=6604 RepID=A0ABY7G5W5_MYAAR|nr:hypothetical protein MAR_002895 [Mya arenaria]